jgi:hypothetical protein
MTHRVFPLPEIVYPLDEATIGTMLARGSELTIYCFTNGCCHNARVNLVAPARKIGPDHVTLDPDLRPYFHCSKCRAAGRPDRKFGFIQNPSTDPHSAWPRLSN